MALALGTVGPGIGHFGPRTEKPRPPLLLRGLNCVSSLLFSSFLVTDLSMEWYMFRRKMMEAKRHSDKGRTTRISWRRTCA